MTKRSILLTGVSSFTGYWFAKTLYANGVDITCPLPRSKCEYTELKKKRLDSLKDQVRLVYDCPYGSGKFIKLCSEHFDTLCLHGSYVLDYTSDRFLLTRALSANLRSTEKTLEILKGNGCKRVIWTSSVFENAVNFYDTKCSKPNWYRYALSKYLSYTAISELCRGYDYEFSRVVITNPFGPLEDKKLSYQVFQSLLNQEEEFIIKTPYYVRDMIHVQNLALVYAETTLSNKFYPEVKPCEYTGSIISFVRRYIEEVGKRTHVKLKIYSKNMDFDEPYLLSNDQHISSFLKDFHSEKYWDDLCNYYFGINKL